jgi:hypothetical protein
MPQRQVSRLLDKSFTNPIFQVRSFAHRSHGLGHAKRGRAFYQTRIRIQLKVAEKGGVSAQVRFHVDCAYASGLSLTCSNRIHDLTLIEYASGRRALICPRRSIR